MFQMHRDEVLRLWSQYQRDYKRCLPGHRPEPRVRKDLTPKQLAEDLETQAKVNFLCNLHPNIQYLKRDGGRIVIPSGDGVVDISPETMAFCTTDGVLREKEKILQWRSNAMRASTTPAGTPGAQHQTLVRSTPASRCSTPGQARPQPPQAQPRSSSAAAGEDSGPDDADMAEADPPEEDQPQADQPEGGEQSQLSNTELRDDPIQPRSTQTQWLEDNGATQFLAYSPPPSPLTDVENTPQSAPQRTTRSATREAARAAPEPSPEEEPPEEEEEIEATATGPSTRQKGKTKVAVVSVRKYIEQGSKKRRVGSVSPENP